MKLPSTLSLKYYAVSMPCVCACTTRAWRKQVATYILFYLRVLEGRLGRRLRYWESCVTCSFLISILPLRVATLGIFSRFLSRNTHSSQHSIRIDGVLCSALLAVSFFLFFFSGVGLSNSSRDSLMFSLSSLLLYAASVPTPPTTEKNFLSFIVNPYSYK